jgi:hypothetical protein
MLIYTACEKDNDLNTDQMGSSKITLKSFGPSPIPRGAELRIIGTNLDKVQSVVISGCDPITEIKIINKNEIRVMVPQNAQVGKIILKTPQGDITSETILTFSEPIEITKMSPNPIKAGQTLKIEGDYLNLINEVILADDVHVAKANFVSQSRQTIEVIVPVEAQTGKVIVSDGADLVAEGEDPGIPIWVYSKDELTVVLPTIEAIAPTTIKAGNTLTITGKDFDLVDHIVFAGDVEEMEYSVNEAFTKIEVIVPAAAQDGVVTLVAKSGVGVESEAITLVVPSNLAASPATVKNGAQLTISGQDLDLVSDVLFGELSATIVSQTATSLVVTVPDEANSAMVTLQTLAEKSVEVAIAYVKPTISSIAPLSITAGDNITVTGTNLDLVREIIFHAASGIVSVNLSEAPAATSITVKTPFTAANGTIDLKTVNGTIVTSTQSLTVAAATLPTVTSMPAIYQWGKLLEVAGINLEKTTKIIFDYGDTQVQVSSYLPNADGTTLQMYVPKHKGNAVLRFYMDTEYGSEYPLSVIPTEVINHPDLVFEDFENHNGHDAGWDDWAGAFNYDTEDDGNKYIEIHDGLSGWSWVYGCNHQSTRGNFPSLDDASKYIMKIDFKTTGVIPSDVKFQFKLGGVEGSGFTNFSDHVTSNNGNNEWSTATVSMTDLGFSGAIDGTSGDWGLILNGGTIPAGLKISVDNLRFEPK